MKSPNIHRFALAVFGFLIVHVVFWVLLRVFGYSFWNIDNWLRFDSWHYLAILEKGYELFPCPENTDLNSPNLIWCGNTGWFYGLPLLCEPFVYLFGHSKWVLTIVVNLFSLLSVFWILKLSGFNSINVKSIVFTLLIAFYWSFFYQHAVFPVSGTVFFMLLAIDAHLKGRLYLVLMACFLASFFYPTGFLLAAAFVLLKLIQQRSNLKNAIKPTLLYLIFGLGGMLVFFVMLYFKVGDFMGFVKVQAKYGHGFHNPLLLMKHSLNLLVKTQNPKDYFVVIQSFLILLFFVFLSFNFFKRRMFENQLYLTVYTISVFYLIFPWVIGGELLSLYRAEALLLPSVILLKGTAIKVQLAILCLLLAIGIPMYYLYIDNFLI